MGGISLSLLYRVLAGFVEKKKSITFSEMKKEDFISETENALRKLRDEANSILLQDVARTFLSVSEFSDDEFRAIMSYVGTGASQTGPIPFP